MQGLRPPANYQGLRDEGSLGGDPSLDTLAELYARGLAEDPDVDNTLVGGYYDLYFNEDAEIEMTQHTPSDGVDFDQHQALNLMREFTIGGVVAGTFRRTTMKYNEAVQRGEIELDRAYLRNSADAELLISTDTRQSIDDGIANHYEPPLGGAGRQSQWRSNLADVRNALSPFWRNSDGAIWQQCLLPSEAAHTLRALSMSMNSRDGGLSEAAIGSAIWWGITQPTNDLAGGTEMVSFRGVLDAKNFGSAQIEGHWDVYASTLAGGPALSASFYADRFDVAGNLIVGGDIAAGDLLIGNLDVAGDLSVLGDADVAGELTAAGESVQRTAYSADIDFAATPTGVVIIPSKPGFFANVIGFKIILTAVGGTLGAGGGTFNAGNNGAKTNVITTASLNSGTIATQFAAGIRTWVSISTTAGFNVPAVDLTTPVTLDVTVANNGAGVVLTGKVACTYSLIPAF